MVILGAMAKCAGVPFPGETVLLVAGVMAQRGRIQVGDAVAFGVLGAAPGAWPDDRTGSGTRR